MLSIFFFFLDTLELAVGNVVRQVLHIICEEDLSLTTSAIGGLSLAAESDDDNDVELDDHPVLSASAVAAASRNILRAPSLQILLEDMPHLEAIPHTYSSGGDSEEKTKSGDKNAMTKKLKHNVIEAVNELIQEISTCHEQIAEQAVEHIHHKYRGHALAKELAARGLQTTVITDSAVFAVISRVNMVVGAHAVMANGGIVAPMGLNMVALADQRSHLLYSLGCTSCAHYNPEVLLNELKSPSELLDFGEFSDCLDFASGAGSPRLHVVNLAFDYVPLNLVSLFITDM